jgi:hypothetical protein
MSVQSNPWPNPLAAAKAILAAHPALVSLDAAAAAIVAETIDGASGLSEMASAISAQGPASPTGGWATLRDVGSVKEFPATEYDLSEKTRSAAVGPLVEVIRTTQNDSRLEGVLWFPHPAEVGGYRPVAPTPPFTWRVEGIPPRFGVLVSSVAFDRTAGSWRVELGNTAPRMLAVYVEFLDAKGVPSAPAGWTSRLPAGVDPGFETATRKYLGLLLPTRYIEGIPVPEKDAVFDFPQPAGTAEVRIAFGGLGGEPWDAVACPLGAIVTAVLGYAVPAILAFTGVPPAGWYAGLLTSEAVLAEVMQAGSFLRTVTSTPEAFREIAARIGPLLYGGLPALEAVLLQHLSPEQLAEAAAPINWAAATLALTDAPGASFSGSVLGSPASFLLRLSPDFVADLRVEVLPDPVHGAWPATASRYTVEARWEGGSGSAAGKASGLATPSPSTVAVANVPANRSVSLAATVVDAKGQVHARGAGLAVTPAPAPRTAAVVLAEERPALGASTRYAFSLTLAYDASRGHHWVSGPAPTATVRDLNGGSTGHNLSVLVGLQLGAAGRMLGYAWQASGQNLPFCGSSQPTSGQIYAFQTLEALASPEKGLEFPSCGFSGQPFLAFGPAGAGLDFFLDPRQGFLRLRRFTPGQPFDMSPGAPSFGRFNRPRLDAAVIHPEGFALGVSFADGTFETLRIGSGEPTSPEPVAGMSGGTGTASGRFGGPLALALTPGADLLVLESLNRRLQAVDLYGNPVPYFPGGKALLPLRSETSPATYLDLALDGEGYIYVLLYLNQGDAVADYRLDLYAPDGAYLGGTTGVNAARIAIDAWRNVYTLNFAHLLGPGGRTEPTLSVWTPQNP